MDVTRRKPFGYAVVLAIALAASGCTWPMFRWGPARTGFNPLESRINSGNVATLQEVWTGNTAGNVSTSPIVANGSVFVGDVGGTLYAFDAAGEDGCDSAPTSCSPQWTATIGGSVVVSSPAVVDGILYINSITGVLSAFDANGENGCAGTPKACTPLWTSAPLGAANVEGSPVVVGGIVYVAAGDTLHAFDAYGVTNCEPSSRTCSPVWTTGSSVDTPSLPTVWSDVLYVGGEGNRLFAFDRHGIENCSAGTPRTCSPLWIGQAPTPPAGPLGDCTADMTLATCRLSAPAIVQGVAYVGAWEFTGSSGLSGAVYAFDASGVNGCDGTPVTCTPLWRSTAAGAVAQPAVADGKVYATGSTHGPNLVFLSTLRVYDAAAITGCTGSGPKVCTPLWETRAPLPSDPSTQLSPRSLGLANGLVYAGAANSIQAFDAAGATNCAGTPPVCGPLWTAAVGGGLDESPAIVNGNVYVPGDDSQLHVFALPSP